MTRTLQVEEDGTLRLTPDVLGKAAPHTRYVVERRGKRLTLQPESLEVVESKTPRMRRAKTSADWDRERKELAEELGKVWPSGMSVIDVISDMRR